MTTAAVSYKKKSINTLKKADLEGKKVLVRVDFNVPLDDKKNITDNARIVGALPTIKYLIENNAKVILMSHLGRPDGQKNPAYSLAPVAAELSKVLGKAVAFASDCIGAEVEKQVAALQNGAVLLLENVRFYKAEDDKKDAVSRKAFAKQLAALGNIYVNDAFGTAHREHASTANIAEFLPAYSGLLIEKELKYLGSAVNEPKRPLVAILGGAKISDKIPIIENLLKKADKIIIGGGMAYTFYKAQGFEIGKSLLDKNLIDTCKDFLARGKDKIVLPVDVKVTTAFDFKAMKVLAPLTTVDIKSIPADAEGLDIGEKTAAEFSNIIANAGTVIWNGPMGVFECEDTAKGTFAVANALAAATGKGVITVIGGGDSASAIKEAGLETKMTHVSTGGGASLEFLEGKVLPGIAALLDA